MKIAKIQIGFYNLFNNLTKYLKPANTLGPFQRVQAVQTPQKEG